MNPTTTLPPSAPRAYRIEGFIGKGGFGHVYLARNLAEGALGRVALKVLDEDATEPWVARFFHEAQVLSSLSEYPYFVRVHAVFKMERRFCIEMEYISGVTLDALITRAGPLPLPVALHIARQTAVALDAAYTQARDDRGELLRVLHRDLKPGNLRITPGGSVKVLDFGLARSDLRGIRPETLRVLPATLAYMSPERFGFRSDVGHAADVYALGLTLYEMLAGEPFFDLGVINPCLPADLEDLAEWTRIRLDRLEMRSGGSPGLRAILEGALDTDPTRRSDAAALEASLRHLGGLGLEDHVRAWVADALTPLIAALPPPGLEEPWGWVRTVRRSDRDTPTERAGAAPDTIHPTLLAPDNATLDGLTRASGDGPVASQQQVPPVAATQHGGRVWPWVGLGLLGVLGVLAWVATRPEATPPEAPAVETVKTPVATPPAAPEPETPDGEPPPELVAPTVARPAAVATKPPPARPPEVTPEPEPEPVPTGMVSMTGDQAAGVRLGGLSLRPGDRATLAPGSYTATVSFDGGDYPVDVTVKAGETLTFDCTTTRMGSPCQVR